MIYSLYITHDLFKLCVFSGIDSDWIQPLTVSRVVPSGDGLWGVSLFHPGPLPMGLPDLYLHVMTCSSHTHAKIMQSSYSDEQVSLQTLLGTSFEFFWVSINCIVLSIWIQVAGTALGVDPQRGMRRALARLSACTGAQDISRPCRLDHTYKMNQFWPNILTKIGKFHQALLLTNHGGGKELR